MIPRHNIRQAVSILMLSPFYFRLDLVARQQLVREFCRMYLVDSAP